jgi:small subunit ribosomal protein S1
MRGRGKCGFLPSFSNLRNVGFIVVNFNLINSLEQDDNVLNGILGTNIDDIEWGGQDIEPNHIYEGKIIRVESDNVVIDIGHKSEGIVPLDEWEQTETPPEVGQFIKVLAEEVENPITGEEVKGMIVLSKRKAAKIEAWDTMMKAVKEGDVVTGMVNRKIKGGLLVDIGVHVFLPASQVDVRRPSDIGDFIGKPIECMVLKIDETRRNIVVSRRALIESERAERKMALLNQLQEGQIRKGSIKNIAEFGAFIDLGGIDGLLHITDMSWGRISHPSEMVKLDDEVEVVILTIDREKGKISLGMKQKSASPWTEVETRYPVGTRVKGNVVNVMSYGAFVKLEEGIEGLVHISEMSWTKRISHPSEVLAVGDEIEVVVLGINKDKQEISLGVKQTHENPWDKVEERYPVASDITGTVRNLTNYGAFIEIEEGIDGLLHVSDMSWVRKITHPNEIVTKGQKITCRVITVDKKNRRIALGLKQLVDDPWAVRIPQNYKPGQIVTGRVTKITNFGVFVSLEEELEGLLHISELAEHKVDNPEDVVKVGEEIEVKILRVDSEERKIGLSRKQADPDDESNKTPESGGEAAQQTQPQENLKGGIGDGSGPLFKSPNDEEQR